MYNTVYDELFKKVPLHPLLTRKVDAKATASAIASQMKLLRCYLRSDQTFLEIGPGDCSLSFEIAKYVKHVYAVDVSVEITKQLIYPRNIDLILSDGASILLSEGAVDIAYSNQLMEHLHPEDALEQLKNIYKVLVPGGVYICITPNGLSGPHDISRYFDEIETGLHLKEYTYTELDNLLRNVGFSKTKAYIGAGGIYITFPLFIIKLFERIISRLSFSSRRKATMSLPLKVILGRLAIVGIK